MSIPSSLTRSSISKASSKKQNKSNKEEVEKSSSITKTVQIRLSDLGIIKKTPSMEELSINQNRILSIFDETIEKLEIAANLKQLLQHKACKLRKCLPPEHVEYIQTVCYKYTQKFALPEVLKHSVFSKTISTIIDKISKNDSSNTDQTEDNSKFQDEMEDLLDPHIIKAMEMIWNNGKLKAKVLTEWKLKQDPLLTSLINSMKNLRTAMKHRLYMTAFDEKKRERSLRHAWKTNASFLIKIEEVKKELEDQRKVLQSELDRKNAQVNKYQKTIEHTKKTFKNKIITRVGNSEIEMYTDTQISHENQEELAEASKNATTMYETLVAHHIIEEKNLRKIRFKVETQLASWLAKYDNDVGERQAMFEKLTEGYEEEKADFETLTEKFNEQEKEYDILMAEKYEEEQRIWEERAFEFLLNRSARRIQRYWRAYRARKLARRKGKKGKKDASEKKASKKSAAEGKNKKGKGKKDKAEPVELRGPDLNETLGNKFGGDVFDDLQGPGFEQGNVDVDL